MPSFREILKDRRQSGSGILSSVGSAALGSTRESLDFRNSIFKSGTLLNALFPNIKGYKDQIKSSSPKLKPSSLGETLSAEKLDDINRNTKISAMNSVVLPKMAMDMNLIKLNMMKLVTLQGGKISRGPDMFFASAKKREDMYESQFDKKTSPTPVGQSKPEEKKGFLSFLLSVLGGSLTSIISGLVSGILKGGLLASLVIGIGKYFTDEEFRKSVNETVDKFMTTVFGADWLKNFMTGIGILGGALLTLKAAFIAFEVFLYAMMARLAGKIGIPIPGIPGGGRTPPGTPQPGAPSRTPPGVPVPGGPIPGSPDKKTPRGRRENKGKPLSDFGEVGKRREMVKNRSLASKISIKLQTLMSSVRGQIILKKVLLKRFGLAAAGTLVTALFSGGALLPVIFWAMTIWGGVELLSAIDEAIDELQKEGTKPEETTPTPIPPQTQNDSGLNETFENFWEGMYPTETPVVPSTSPTPALGEAFKMNSPTLSSEGVSEDLVKFVKNKEVFSAKAYKDGSQNSIGYGTKATSINEVIGEEEADRRLREELRKFQNYVVNFGKKYNYNWNQKQIEALTSFAYNIGSLDNLTKNGTRSNEEISKKLLEYNKARDNGRLVIKRGLTQRRKEEQLMFLDKQSSSSLPNLSSSLTRPLSASIMQGSIAMADGRLNMSSQPVVVNAPQTTNVQQASSGGMSGGLPSVVDQDFMKYLVGRATQ